MHYSRFTTPAVAASGMRREASASTLAEAISLTAEVCGKPLSPTVAAMLAHDMAEFNDSVILAALARCRMELQGPLKMADILTRIDDGRPDAEEAWRLLPRSESASVVWTDEMAQAWGIALPLLNAGDTEGARQVFGEAYAKAVLDARIQREPVHWVPSLGSDVAGRESALRDAVCKRRLSVAHAEELLPARAAPTDVENIGAQVKWKSMH
jgi:hypothetical protein